MLLFSTTCKCIRPNPLSHTRTLIHIRNFMGKKHPPPKKKETVYPLLPKQTQCQNTFIPISGIWNHSRCSTVRCRYKVCKYVYRWDLEFVSFLLTNATEMITEMALMQMRSYFQRRKCWLKCLTRIQKDCTFKTHWFHLLALWQIFQTTVGSDHHCFSITGGLTRQINERKPLEILQLLLCPTHPNWMVHECFTE